MDGGVGDFRITSAIYGVHGKEVNVTDRLNALVADGVLDITVDNETMGGDPASGQGKMLRLRWTSAKGDGASAFLEGTHVVVP